MSARKRRSVTLADIAISKTSLLKLVRKQETIVVGDRIGAKDHKSSLRKSAP